MKEPINTHKAIISIGRVTGYLSPSADGTTATGARVTINIVSINILLKN